MQIDKQKVSGPLWAVIYFHKVKLFENISLLESFTNHTLL